MNWERLETILRELVPEAPAGIGEQLRSKYRGEDFEQLTSDLTQQHQKIVREAFIKESKDKPNARDHARAFIGWAINNGYEFRVNERYRSAGNIAFMVEKYWKDHDEEEKINQAPDVRIQYIFARLKHWTKKDKLQFLLNHNEKKLTWYAYIVWDARDEVIAANDPYVSWYGILAEGYHTARSAFDTLQKTLNFDDPGFWQKCIKGYKGIPNRR